MTYYSTISQLFFNYAPQMDYSVKFSNIHETYLFSQWFWDSIIVLKICYPVIALPRRQSEKLQTGYPGVNLTSNLFSWRNAASYQNQRLFPPTICLWQSHYHQPLFVKGFFLFIFLFPLLYSNHLSMYFILHFPKYSLYTLSCFTFSFTFSTFLLILKQFLIFSSALSFLLLMIAG